MRLLSVVSLLIIGVATSPVYADTGWLFVPVLPASADQARAEKLVRAFEVAAGEGATRNVAASQQFERLRSREPAAAAAREVAEAEEAAQAAVKKLGSGKLRPGQLALEQTEAALAGEHGDGYRRDRERVQVLWDACSLSAMLLSRAKRHDDAAAQMERCVRAYPSFAPEGEPEIQPLFDAAAARVAHGVLDVAGGDGCIVRANGLELGPAPLKKALPVGDYRLQIECSPGVIGRIHVVRVDEGTNHVAFDPLDARVHTRPGLWLQHSESVDSDGRALERLLGVKIVLLIAEGDASTRVRFESRDIAVVTAGDDVRSVIALLEAPPSAKPAPAAPAIAAAPIASTPLELSESTHEKTVRRSPLEYVAGVSLMVVGAGALTAGWVLYGQRDSIRSRYYATDVPYGTRDRFEDLGVAMLGVSAFGALAFTAAEPFLISADDGIPSAAWVLAAGGLVLAGAGIGFGVADHCEAQVATRQVAAAPCGFVNDALFGPLLALHGAPLLALPLAYGLRQLIGGESMVVLGFDGTGGRVGLGGTF